MTEFGECSEPIRNIIFKIDGTELVLDLIPETILDEQSNHEDEPNLKIRELLRSSKPIVEAERFLRLEFEHILAVAVDTDIDVDLFGGLLNDWASAPRMPPKNTYYPLLEICDSPWKSQLPDHRGRDDPNIYHIKAISMECSFDILGLLPVGNWSNWSKMGR